MRAYRVAYDGRAYHGFQRQPDVPTVADAVLDALRALDVLDADADVPPGYAAAGRTDAGVSALAQTVAFRAPDWLTPAAFNSELPADVRAWASADVPDDFHATHDAAARAYVYHLHAPRPAIDDQRAREPLERLGGERDFHNLTPDETGTVRDLDGALRRDGEFLVVRLESDGFPRQFVRRVVSLVHAVGRGERDRAAVDRVLAPEPLPGPEGVPPAPAAGLVLADVEYPGVEFTADPDAVASARAVFRDRRVERATGARVAETVERGLDGP
ncbi:MAG: tRNA pseudouridine(38-40) synthase TruA [Haloarculaceae archaeon]